VASLLLVLVLPSSTLRSTNDKTTTIKLNAIEVSLRQFQAANGRLPCPADASVPMGSAKYGVEASAPGSNTNCSGGSPTANYIDSTNHVAIGMIPVRSLGLSADYALDSYRREITYAVDTRATSCWPSTSLTGELTISDNGTAANSIAALISHGADGHGAWIPLTGSSGAAVRLNAGSTDSDQLTNAHVNASFTTTLPYTNFVRKRTTSTFDDLVVYSNPIWNINSIPQSIQNANITVVSPANGRYTSGQILTFILNFPTTVTVTGTPSLGLSASTGFGSIGTGNHAYANYSSGSGTKALTFAYTIQASDIALSGITLSPTIIMNGGTISPCFPFFTAPNLSRVFIGTGIFVSDAYNNNVQVFDLNGGYLGQFGSAGSGNGQLSGPLGIAFDAFGNIWVAEGINNRVQEFSSSGNYLGQFGSTGSGNGQLSEPIGIVFDATGNIWVGDGNNARIQEFTSAGVYIRQVGTSGTGNGQFSVAGPATIVFDSSGNLWATDDNFSRVEGFSSTGTYIGQFGSYGSGNGQFYGDLGMAIDAGGNFWVSDNHNSRIEKFSSSGTYISQFGSVGTGNGQFGSPGPAIVEFDPNGNLWVMDTANDRIEEFNSSGVFLRKFGSAGTGPGQFSYPGMMAIGSR
jgi:hypothetical protein